MNYKILLLSILIYLLPVKAANVMSIGSFSGNANDTLTITLAIENSDAFSAFQTDIVIPSQVQLIPQSVKLTSRRTDHLLSATQLSNSNLRIIAYSLTNSNFFGNTGSVVEFKIKLRTFPGNYQLTLLESTISSNQSTNVLTSVQNGSVTVKAPDITIQENEIDFGRIPLTSTMQKSLTIRNNGNMPLNISNITTDCSLFEILNPTQIIIPPGGQWAVSIRFNSNVKGVYNNKVLITSNDPDKQVASCNLKAVAFAVNEFRVIESSCKSGDTVSVKFKINNMENFTAFQFDLLLPSTLSTKLITAGIQRNTDHQISAEMIGNNKIRVIAFSPTNSTFTGNDGIISSLNLQVTGIGGCYNLAVDNVVVSSNTGDNILSAAYDNYLNIAAPNIYCDPNINFGEVSVLTSKELQHDIFNTGNADLIVTKAEFANSSFTCNTALPITIPAGQNATLTLLFSNSNSGSYNSSLKLYSNDPDLNITRVNLFATAYNPNYITVNNTSDYPDSIVTVSINVDNIAPFVAFQFDLNFPPELAYIANSAKLTGRAQGHSLIQSSVSSNKVRLISYSSNQQNFIGNTGEILDLKFKINPACVKDSLAITITEAILGNAASQNILHGTKSGSIYLRYKPVLIYPIVDVSFAEDSVSTSINLNSVFSIARGTLSYGFSGYTNLHLEENSGIVKITPNPNWNGNESVFFKAYNQYGDSISDHVMIYVTPVNDAPVCSTLPVISGTLAIGATITGTSGAWNDLLDNAVAVTTTYQWQRADNSLFTANLVSIENATGITYNITTADKNKYLRLKVTGTDTGTPTPVLSATAYSNYISMSIPTFILTYSTSNTAHGSISGINSQIVDAGANGSEVVAIPATGYHFVKWSDDVTTASRTDLNVTANISVTALFEANDYSLTLSVNPTEAATLTGAGAAYHIGDQVVITATANPGFAFVNWTKTTKNIAPNKLPIGKSKDQAAYCDTISTISDFTFNMPAANVELVANFSIILSVEHDKNPTTTSLSQNYPNPYNPRTTINFAIANDAQVNLAVYNIKGEVVKSLVNSSLKAGYHSIDFDATGLNSGVYIYKMTTQELSFTKKMVFSK